jgi:hypothetical protein
MRLKYLLALPFSLEDETWVQARYIVVFAAFLVNAVCFMMRINLSVAIVAISLDTNNNNTVGNATQDIQGPVRLHFFIFYLY